MYADNPVLLAYVEAVKLFPRARQFIVVSLGTGSVSRSYPYEQVRHWGYVEWVSPAHGVPLAAITASGQSEAANHQLRRLPRVKFFRFDGSLEGCSMAVDDASPENIANLREAAERIIAEQDSEINALCHLLH